MSENVLVRARRYLGYTQEEMADALGISRSTYQRRERLADDYVPVAEVTRAQHVAVEAFKDYLLRGGDGDV